MYQKVKKYIDNDRKDALSGIVAARRHQFMREHIHYPPNSVFVKDVVANDAGELPKTYPEFFASKQLFKTQKNVSDCVLGCLASKYSVDIAYAVHTINLSVQEFGVCSNHNKMYDELLEATIKMLPDQAESVRREILKFVMNLFKSAKRTAVIGQLWDTVKESVLEEMKNRKNLNVILSILCHIIRMRNKNRTVYSFDHDNKETILDFLTDYEPTRLSEFMIRFPFPLHALEGQSKSAEESGSEVVFLPNSDFEKEKKQFLHGRALFTWMLHSCLGMNKHFAYFAAHLGKMINLYLNQMCEEYQESFETTLIKYSYLIEQAIHENPDNTIPFLNYLSEKEDNFKNLYLDIDYGQNMEKCLLEDGLVKSFAELFVKLDPKRGRELFYEFFKRNQNIPEKSDLKSVLELINALNEVALPKTDDELTIFRFYLDNLTRRVALRSKPSALENEKSLLIDPDSIKVVKFENEAFKKHEFISSGNENKIIGLRRGIFLSEDDINTDPKETMLSEFNLMTRKIRVLSTGNNFKNDIFTKHPPGDYKIIGCCRSYYGLTDRPAMITKFDKKYVEQSSLMLPGHLEINLDKVWVLKKAGLICFEMINIVTKIRKVYAYSCRRGGIIKIMKIPDTYLTYKVFYSTKGLVAVVYEDRKLTLSTALIGRSREGAEVTLEDPIIQVFVEGDYLIVSCSISLYIFKIQDQTLKYIRVHSNIFSGPFLYFTSLPDQKVLASGTFNLSKCLLNLDLAKGSLVYLYFDETSKAMNTTDRLPQASLQSSISSLSMTVNDRCVSIRCLTDTATTRSLSIADVKCANMCE